MNPPKEKTVRRAFRAIPGSARRELAKLAARNRYALAVFNWLESHVDGWRTTVEKLADALACSSSSVYGAIATLRHAGFLDVTDDVWRLQLAGSAPVESRARALLQEKNQSLREASSMKRHSEETERRHAGKRESSRMTQTPDAHGREEVAESKKMKSIVRFVEVWGREFPRNGPASTSVLSSRWQERLIFVRRFWSRDEIVLAFRRTRDRQQTSAIWQYFCAVLESIAAGTYVDDAELERKREARSRPQNIYREAGYQWQDDEAAPVVTIDPTNDDDWFADAEVDHD